MKTDVPSKTKNSIFHVYIFVSFLATEETVSPDILFRKLIIASRPKYILDSPTDKSIEPYTDKKENLIFLIGNLGWSSYKIIYD
jgi:hypothetical protein